ncbi:hypothetical protein MKW92_025817 [Papaver armeniacum]|nr:hypothetical protein MKW92_025817 [Papaver armeniacum]
MESWKSDELEEEEDSFFDIREDITSISDSGSEKFDLGSNTSPLIENWVSDGGSRYEIWIENPGSVNERPHKFHKWMGLGGSDELNCIDSGRITGALGLSLVGHRGLSGRMRLEKRRILCDDGVVSLVRETDAAVERRPVERRKRVKKSWLKKLCHLVGVFARRKRGAKVKLPDSDAAPGAKVKRVRVRPLKKRSKEMSALYMGQEIHAHKGSILTMKFSPDGLYLASAGEDGIVRIPDIDPSCVYFKVNHFSELAPLFAAKEKSGMFKSMRISSHSACVVFPPKVIRISDKPLHEFHGHNSEVLDLSWSNNKHLLSSSVDNTVRLWQVWQDQCLKIFSHNNYVTSVHFNPVNDDFFISSSIDGKVRIWTISGSQVVDWTDIKEIVTAVSYRPDGQVNILALESNFSSKVELTSFRKCRHELELVMAVLSSRTENSCFHAKVIKASAEERWLYGGYRFHPEVRELIYKVVNIY